MNIDNVVLVRAMNNLPLNGELVPSCEGQRLVNDHKSDFYYFMKSCVREKFREFINEYNQYTQNNYLTNQQIVSLYNNKTMN